MGKVSVLNVKFDDLSIDSFVERALVLTGSAGHYAVTPNPEMVVNAGKDPELAAALENADLVLPDGIGVVIASKLFPRGKNAGKIRERVAGVDFAEKLMSRAEGKGVFLFGGAKGVAERALVKLAERYPATRFVGSLDGYFTDEDAAIDAIKSANPDILFVCLGSPKQEKLMARRRGEFKFAVGLGGCLDVWSGDIKRAPDFFRNHGLEWLYRLSKQPSRIFRAVKLPYFLLLCLFEYLFKKDTKS